MSKKKVYIASKTEWAEQWRQFAEGEPRVQLVCRWIFGEKAVSDLEKLLLWERIFEDIEQADCLILFIGHGDASQMKGALVEAGAALMRNIPVHIIDPNNEYAQLGTWTHHGNVDFYYSMHEWCKDNLEYETQAKQTMQHLDSPPAVQCSDCYRKSYVAGDEGKVCNLRQPSGRRCPGLMVRIGEST